MILAHAKNLVHELLLESDVPEDPGVAGILVDYFPEPLRGAYSEQIYSHALRREIIATRLSTELIDRGRTAALDWIAHGGLEVAEPERFLSLHEHHHGQRDSARAAS